MEHGTRIGQGRHIFQTALLDFVAGCPADLPPRMVAMFRDMAEELYAEIKAVAATNEVVSLLLEISGVGSAIASALVVAVSTGNSSAKRPGSDCKA